MAHQNETSAPSEDSPARGRGLGYSLRHSLVTPYWPFNFLEMAYVTLGMAVAAASHPWDWETWGLGMAFIWLGSAGVNNMDLSDEGLTLDVDSRVQRVVGGLMLAASVLLGGYLAARTTWWFFALVVTAVVTSMTYSLELFGGRFHDRAYLAGIGNLAFTAAWIPTVAGYLLGAGAVTVDVVGIGLVAVGLMVLVMAVDVVEDDLKRHKYENFGIEHDRSVDPDYERLERRAAKQQPMHMLAVCSMAVGFVVLFGV